MAKASWRAFIGWAICGFIAFGAVYGSADPGTQIPARGNLSLQAASRWEEGFLTGNGTIGAIVFGRTLDETIVVSHQKLFLPWEKPIAPVNQAALLPKIRALLAAGEYQKASDLVVEQSRREGYGDKRWTDPLIPAFDLRLFQEKSGEPSDFSRAVDFQTGVVTTRWRDSRGAFVRRVFSSRADNVLVLSLALESGAPFDARLALMAHPPENPGDEAYWAPLRKFQDGIKNIDVRTEGTRLTYESGFVRIWEGGLRGYEGAARVRSTGSTLSTEHGELHVRGAREILVVLRVDVLKDGRPSGLAGMESDLERLAARGFDSLLAEHVKIHGRIFNRVRLDLGASPADRLLPSETLLDKQQNGALNKALLERQFDFCRYAILSSTGDWPPALQGIWTGTWGPPWSGDYTQNGNVQSALASALCGAMPETLKSYFRYLEQTMADMRRNARDLFGASGIFLASRTSSHGLNNHFDRTWPMTFWTAGAAWAARFYYDYWLYTGDREFLVKRALPFMREAAAFYEDFLIPGPEGRLMFAPSYSPENVAKNTGSQAGLNATMDVSLARELFTNLITGGREAGLSAFDIATWEKMRAALPDYRINSDGAIAEWAWPELDDDYQHRHASHLVGLFDGVPPDIAARPDWLAAFRRALDMRMDHRRTQKQQEMAFGLVQLGQAAATLRDAKSVAEIIGWLGREFWLTSLSPTHNSRDIFNVDICGGLPAVMIRALLQSEPGRLDFLPALPADWPSGRIKGLPARGQILVKSLEWRPGGFTAVISSAEAQKIRISAPGEILKHSVRGGEAIRWTENSGVLSINLRNGIETHIEVAYGSR